MCDTCPMMECLSHVLCGEHMISVDFTLCIVGWLSEFFGT